GQGELVHLIQTGLRSGLAHKLQPQRPQPDPLRQGFGAGPETPGGLPNAPEAGKGRLLGANGVHKQPGCRLRLSSRVGRLEEAASGPLPFLNQLLVHLAYRLVAETPFNRCIFQTYLEKLDLVPNPLTVLVPQHPTDDPYTFVKSSLDSPQQPMYIPPRESTHHQSGQPVLQVKSGRHQCDAAVAIGGLGDPDGWSGALPLLLVSPLHKAAGAPI